MKYLILVPDGAADRPIEKLGGKTPLEVAEIHNINSLARKGEVGRARTIPDGIPPGSDAANLAVMGYDPKIYLTGRSPLEAVSMGIDMDDTDVAFRTNLVTLEDGIVKDHSAGDISNEEARVLIELIDRELGTDKLKFYTGVSYRHALIMKDGEVGLNLIPPHDILGQKAEPNLPKVEFVRELMLKSYELLKDHPINKERINKGLNPANSIWIWGEGKRPNLSSFYDKYGIRGSVISAVDLIKGIGLCAGLDSIDVEGATGTLDTNFRGKAEATIEEFEKGKDFVYVHLEAPDECSHQGDMRGKIEALKLIDERVLSPILDYFKKSGGDFRILIVPDHRTPLEIRTHSSEPVPYVIYDSRNEKSHPENAFAERSSEGGRLFENGYELADYFFER